MSIIKDAAPKRGGESSLTNKGLEGLGGAGDMRPIEILGKNGAGAGALQGDKCDLNQRWVEIRDSLTTEEKRAAITYFCHVLNRRLDFQENKSYRHALEHSNSGSFHHPGGSTHHQTARQEDN